MLVQCIPAAALDDDNAAEIDSVNNYDMEPVDMTETRADSRQSSVRKIPLYADWQTVCTCRPLAMVMHLSVYPSLHISIHLSVD